MAGARICASVSLPLPKRSTVSTQPAAAPGTVTACTELMGMVAPVAPSGRPRSCRMRSSVQAAPERPEPLSADTDPVAAS
jgi:hypothetical protein